MEEAPLHIVGDVHGLVEGYIDGLIVHDVSRSIQVGDFSILESDFQRRIDLLEENGLDPQNHRLFGGNHDFYGSDLAPYEQHTLGHFGPVPGIEDSFFIRGAESIDKDRRIFGKTWFEDEQLGYREGLNAIYTYDQIRPRIVFSHDAPASLVRELFSPHWAVSNTRKLLQQLFMIHEPDHWFLGHFHESHHHEWGNTTFHILDELEFFPFDLNAS